VTLLAAFDWQALFFMLFAALACVFAAAVLFTANIVRMAFYLTLSGAHFVGAMQLMIYVGGTLVLLIFGVMLTAQARFISLRTRSGEWIAALIVGSLLLVLLIGAAFSVEPWRVLQPASPLGLAEAQSTTALGAGLTGIRVDKLNEADATTRGGMSGYLLPFVIVSVHLLVVLIGAAYMARTKRYQHQPPSEDAAGEPAG
jgi:NADH-quinone oxidoreductase subunit J